VVGVARSAGVGKAGGTQPSSAVTPAWADPAAARTGLCARLHHHGLWLYFYALTAHFGQWVPQAGKRWPLWQVFVWIYEFVLWRVHQEFVAGLN
jgi:hypothetical protein